LGFGGNSSMFIPIEELNKVDQKGSPTPPDDYLRSLQKPTGYIVRGTAVKLATDQPYEVSVLSNGKPKPLRMVAGYPYVDFEKDEKFDLQIINQSEEHVAATLLIDGLNTFYFSKEPTKHGDSWVITGKQPNKPNGPFVLKGWYQRQGVADGFIATTYDKSRLKESGGSEAPIGGITVLFSYAVEKEDKSQQRYETVKRTIPKEGGGTVTRDFLTPIFSAQSVYAPGEGAYIGKDGVMHQVQGDVSKFGPGMAIGTITIRYRHPEGDK
jgi:hypothetical protein